MLSSHLQKFRVHTTAVLFLIYDNFLFQLLENRQERHRLRTHIDTSDVLGTSITHLYFQNSPYFSFKDDIVTQGEGI